MNYQHWAPTAVHFAFQVYHAISRRPVQSHPVNAILVGRKTAVKGALDGVLGELDLNGNVEYFRKFHLSWKKDIEEHHGFFKEKTGAQPALPAEAAEAKRQTLQAK